MPAIAGEDDVPPAVAAVQSGAHCFGVPEQLAPAWASNTDTTPPGETAYTLSLVTAIEPTPAGVPVQSGVHVFGVPPQPMLPAASNAARPDTVPM